MANPRATVRYDEIGTLDVTFKTDNTITYDRTKPGGSDQVGLAVTLAADDTAGLIGDGEQLLGILQRVEADGKALVRIRGYAYAKAGTGATLTLGGGIVGALLSTAEGYIKTGTGRGFIQNNDDTTKVLIYLF